MTILFKPIVYIQNVTLLYMWTRVCVWHSFSPWLNKWRTYIYVYRWFIWILTQQLHFECVALKKQTNKKKTVHMASTSKKKDDSYTIKNSTTTKTWIEKKRSCDLSHSVINFLQSFFTLNLKKRRVANTTQASFNFITCSFLQCIEKCN